MIKILIIATFLYSYPLAAQLPTPPTPKPKQQPKPQPDRDGDGFKDKVDECPNQRGTVRGCPDSDGDGVADKDDLCPNEGGSIKGCPDSDGDGIADRDDLCPNQSGKINGCPDSDGDGVADKDDSCKLHGGKTEWNGCPVLLSQKQVIEAGGVVHSLTTRGIGNYIVAGVYNREHGAYIKEWGGIDLYYPWASEKIDSSKKFLLALAVDDRKDQWVFAAHFNGSLTFFLREGRDFSYEKSIKLSNEYITNLIFRKPYLFLDGSDGKLRRFNFSDNTTAVFGDFNSQALALDVTLDGKLIVNGCMDGSVSLWNAESLKIQTTKNLHKNGVRAIKFSIGNGIVISADGSGVIKISSSDNLDVVTTLEGHTGSIRDISLSQDEKYMATAGDDGTIKIWDLKNYKLLTSLKAHKRPVNSVIFCNDSKTLISGSEDGTIGVWELKQ